MKLATTLVVLAALAVGPAFADGTFLIKYMNNLTNGDQEFHVTNTGASKGQIIPSGGGTLVANGNICVNVYTFTPDEQLSECCSCFLTPNALGLFSRSGLITNPITGVLPNDLVIKLVASAACTPNTDPSSQTFGQCVVSNSFTSCNPGTVGQTDPFNGGIAIGQPLVGGLAAWGTTLHANTSTSPVTYSVTETPFDKATLSASELSRITGLCANILQNGSGSGTCKACSF
jgi:hypothetical protein